MTANLQFYGVSAIIALIISFGWWHSEKEKIGIPWLLITLPLFWCTLASSIIIASTDTSIPNAISLSVDVRYYYRGHSPIDSRSTGALAMIVITTFTLLFKHLWHLKNKPH